MRPLTGGPRPSDASSTSRRGSGELKLIAGELPASAVGWASIFGLSSNPWDTQDTPYSLLTLLLTSTADGDTTRASTCRHKQLQRQPPGVQGLAAHRDFNGARSGSGGARRGAGHGEAPTAALRPESEGNGSVEGYGGLELALGLLSSWRSCWGSLVAWKGARRANLVAAARSLASGAREGNECVVRWRGFYREWRRRRASTSAGDTGRQAVACPHARTRRCARGGCAGQGRHDPYWVTVAIHILPFLSFCEIRPKFELQSKFYQNKNCAEIYRLQNIF